MKENAQQLFMKLHSINFVFPDCAYTTFALVPRITYVTVSRQEERVNNWIGIGAILQQLWWLVISFAEATIHFRSAKIFIKDAERFMTDLLRGSIASIYSFSADYGLLYFIRSVLHWCDSRKYFQLSVFAIKFYLVVSI